MILALFLASLRAVGGDPVDEPSVLRAYDVGRYLAGTSKARASHQLFPIYAEVPPREGEELPGEEAVHVLSDLVQRLNPEQWQLNGREIMVDDLGRMLVRAPSALQDSTARALGFFESVFERTIDLAIDVVTLPASGEALPSVVPVADVARYLGQSGVGTGPRSYRLRLAPGRSGCVDSTRTIGFVADYDVQIAELVSNWSPYHLRVTIGTQIVAQAASAPRGVWLAAVVRAGAQIGEIEAREISFDGLSVSEQRTTEIRAPRTLQRVGLANRSLCVNTFVPEGKALVFQSILDIGGSRVQELVFVRQEGASIPATLRLDADVAKGSSSPEMLFVQYATAVPPRAVLECYALMQSKGPLPSTSLLHERYTWAQASVLEQSGDRLMNLLQLQDMSISPFTIGGWTILQRNHDSVDPSAEKVDPLTAFARLTPEPRLVQVSLTMRRGASDVIARVILPVRCGELSAVVVGREGSEIVNWSVEVAKGSTGADPLVSTTFEGLIASVEPRVTLSGSISLVVAARGAARRGAARAFDAGTSSFSLIDQSDRDQLSVNESVYFAKEGGPRRATLGALAPTGDALSLDIELQELR